MKSIYNIIKRYFKRLMLFTTSYSINVFDSPLSDKEEQYYIDRLLDGDKNARNKLIEHNLRLVAHIVKKYESKNISSDDLISIGTYAAKCAENEILMYFRSNKKHNNTVSLNDIIAHDKEGNDIALIDVIEENTTDLNTTLEYKDNIKHLSKYLDVLNDREFLIIKMRYGLFNEEELTQKEIAKKLHISRSYVSRIEKRALIKMLREFIKHNNI